MFFETEEKNFHILATKMIKKLSKLYDMADNDTNLNESIYNWEWFQKIYNENYKITNEIKFPIKKLK